tara:strand:- start:294 stop:1574 length:1281 start_codon:yes stop_codon:yes gene_type:complete
MASVNPLLSQISSGETIRDYKHASKTFVDNNYELQPKYSNLFHVVFEFTADAATLFDTTEQLEIPLLVKSADLPAYTLDVQTHNQYNRKTQSHHSFTYQPVTIRFHDDTKEVIRKMWHKYYIFYNADPTYDLDGNAYTTSDKYSNRSQQQWGLQRGNKRFFKNIKIYSMQNHKFGEYTLVNPIITSFNHDAHSYANGGLMENTMQLAYETVKYATGYVNNINPRGFGDIHYDIETSDLSATTIPDNSAFIDGTLQNVSSQPVKDLFDGNVIGTITDADIIFNQTQLTGASILTDTINIFANNLISGKKPASNILVPIAGGAESLLNKTFKGAEDKIVNFFTGTTSSQSNSGNKVKVLDGIVSTQGTNIQTYNNGNSSNTFNVGGNTKQIPDGRGTKSNASRISDVRSYAPNSAVNNTISDIVDGVI